MYNWDMNQNFLNNINNINQEIYRQNQIRSQITLMAMGLNRQEQPKRLPRRDKTLFQKIKEKLFWILHY